MTIKTLDLFAGAGGLSLGFEKVRDGRGRKVFELYRAVEIDKYACATLRENFGHEKVIEGDITKIKIHKQIIKECNGKVDIVMGGIPCQSFSLIGPRSGYGKKMDKFKQDKRDDLYKEFKKIVKEINPKIVVIENVKGILSKKDKKSRKIIDKLFSDFEKLGYAFENNKDSKKYMLLNAVNYGVPQRRERVIIIGILKKWKNIPVPFIKPTHFESDSDPSLHSEETGRLPAVNMYAAIGDLPTVEPKITYTGLTLHQKARIIKKNKFIKNGANRVLFDKKRFSRHLNSIGNPGKQFFNFVRSNGHEFLDYHIARSQQLSDVMLFKLMKEGETAAVFVKRSPVSARRLIKYDMTTFKDKYRKQTFNETSTTLFAHLEKDGNRFIHPKQARTITPREAARLQSFPDDFVFEGPVSKKFKQIGNAVPPLVAFNIGETIYPLFGE